MTNDVGPSTDVILNDEEVLILSKPFVLKSKVGISDKAKRPSCHTPLKRPSQDKSTSTKSDECWKKLRLLSDIQKDTNFYVVKIAKDSISSSRTLIVVKEVMILTPPLSCVTKLGH